MPDFPEHNHENGLTPQKSGWDEAAIAADVEKYLIHLADLDLPLAAKIELVKAVQFIMQSFVDRAFGDDPVQQAIQHRDKSDGKDATLHPSVVGSKQEATPHNRTDLSRSFLPHGKRPGGESDST